MHLKDVIAVDLPENSLLQRIASKARKTKEAIEFAVADSPVLTRIAE